MTKIKFSDGIEFELNGEYRVERRIDGLYVVGKGMLIPVDNETEAEDIIAKLKGGNKVQTT